jgi:phosphate starvation-inducible PhoH-like protein
VLTPFDNERLVGLCGKFDENLRVVEKELGVKISNRGNNFKIYGEKQSVQISKQLLNHLYDLTATDADLAHNQLHIALQQYRGNKTSSSNKPDANSIRLPKGAVTPKTSNQVKYLKNIQNNDVNFGIGPAGTGKTFLAVACAVNALESHQVRRIILVRPVVEAGEKLGFLPGDLAQKIDPYLRPLYDALYEMLGFERVARYLEQHIIEIVPLAYMRGRTLSDAFIILDESQNTTEEQMKMFLTRIGFNSTSVITGDITQSDLPRGKSSGLNHAIKILQNINHISFTNFDSKDVIRHPVVQKIIDAYEKYENNYGENSDN